MTETVLVLGATGKTGRRLVPRLIAAGAMVRSASRRPGEGRTLFDWDRPDTHDASLTGADAVYLIGPELVEDPSAVVGPFLERARRAGVRKLVALSSMGVEFPREPSGSGRRTVEQLVMASGLAWTLLRPTGFAQNFSEGFLLPGILQAGAVATATGDGSVAFVDADDIAAVAAAVLTEPGHAEAIYAITGPEALSFAQATAIIGGAAGRPIAHRRISSDELTHLLLGFGLPPAYAAMVVGDQEAIRDGEGARVTDVVARVTGRPATPFAEYAARAANAWVRPQ
ncbi:MAG TPA: NAD(P)H-binding protein [Aliidongia sp.]|uniref:NAD(P)H-binding protein n=1 Tax=Aliidongia sp. TaxID=1914230 RepID=UPI002DDCADEA|nr:NAD(P)H-binding protein [Aliidongia sp.]HEV2678673.1 NAD(P)H-binding protein [Aliidongia sp.]